jgi:hypothetical protein
MGGIGVDRKELLKRQSEWCWPPPMSEATKKECREKNEICRRHKDGNVCGGRKCPFFIPDTSSCGIDKVDHKKPYIEMPLFGR